MQYFEFEYIVFVDGEIVNQADALYYTSAGLDLNEMIFISRNSLEKSFADITINFVKEINRDFFIMKGGDSNIY
jgi:hypothetical protein